jgi:integrase/recombinase XerD
MKKRTSRAPFPTDSEHWRLEVEAAEQAPAQLPLMGTDEAAGGFTALLGVLPELEATSSLDLARAWFRRDLETTGHPANTIESYLYDLVILEKATGSKPINEIGAADIARLLSSADNRSTRKRRLTSVRQFFAFLTGVAKVLDADPTEGFYPHSIILKSPTVLFANEQAALLEAAGEDEPWSLTAIWLMMRLGLSRQELLALRRDHIDLSEPARPIVHISYEEAAKRGKERRIAGDAEFAAVYEEYLERRHPADLLFPYGFQAINEMVGRVAAAAELTKHVTPQVLRHAFAIDRARQGADERQLLALLGLADDPRNRESVRRYINLAAPPL